MTEEQKRISNNDDNDVPAIIMAGRQRYQAIRQRIIKYRDGLLAAYMDTFDEIWLPILLPLIYELEHHEYSEYYEHLRTWHPKLLTSHAKIGVCASRPDSSARMAMTMLLDVTTAAVLAELRTDKLLRILILAREWSICSILREFGVQMRRVSPANESSNVFMQINDPNCHVELWFARSAAAHYYRACSSVLIISPGAPIEIGMEFFECVVVPLMLSRMPSVGFVGNMSLNNRVFQWLQGDDSDGHKKTFCLTKQCASKNSVPAL